MFEKEDIVKSFEKGIWPDAKKVMNYKEDDDIAKREEFNNYLDFLAKEGIITWDFANDCESPW